MKKSDFGLCIVAVIFQSCAVGGLACNPQVPPPGNGGEPANTTDPTNRGAPAVGSEACRQCHPTVAESHNLHGHAHILNAIQGGPPTFPDAASGAGVPQPPEGFEWSDIAFVVGGYTRKGQFIDQSGFLIVTGATGVDTQWILPFPANGADEGFVPYEPDLAAPKPYDFDCFRCHTTGAEPQDPGAPQFHEGRPGIPGTWDEAGVQCEACHGPGGNHFTTVGREVVIDRSAIFVGSEASLCGQCHARGNNPDAILAADDFIQSYQQWSELRASGGHSEFRCTLCHDPHVSVNFDRPNAIRNECVNCHPSQNMALHEQVVYMRGDYTERLSCTSCHMPFATKSATAAGPDVVGENGHMGDLRTHIFRINTDVADRTAMFSADGTRVRTDAAGRAAVTVDFVCLRCHNAIGNAFALPLDSASDIALRMHGNAVEPE